MVLPFRSGSAKCCRAVAAVRRPKQREQGRVLLNAQQLPACKHITARREIAEEGDDLAQRVGAAAGEYAADIDDVVDS